MDKHLPKDGVSLPKPGTAARYVIDQWSAKGKLAWSDLMGIYLFRLRQKNPRKQEQYATYNLKRLLNAHGFKEGKSCDRSPWVYGARFPTPGTFTVQSAPPPPPSILPAAVPAHVFAVGDTVTCEQIGRSVLAKIVSKTPDGYCRIKWPNGLHDDVPLGLLKLVSPAPPPTNPVSAVADSATAERPKPKDETYVSERTKRLRMELAESIRSDSLKRWAQEAAQTLRDELAPEKYAALVEEMVDG